MRHAVTVLSLLPRLLALAEIAPDADVMSLTDMRIFPAGDVITPDRDIVIALPPPVGSLLTPDAKTVVPSHNLTTNVSPVPPFNTVTVPVATHVPDDP